ncbi:MAG: DUF305 domain-containing protein [Polyangiaceae bacterium]
MIELLKERVGDLVPAHHRDPGEPSGAEVGIVGDRRVTFTPSNDVEFIDFFVPHHENAVMMAEHVMHHGYRPSVRALAASVVESQSKEIAAMKSIREALTGTAEPPAPPMDPEMHAVMERMMTASGPALDILFLVEMIPHHAAGLGPAHRGRPNLTRQELLAIADGIYTNAVRGDRRDESHAPRWIGRLVTRAPVGSGVGAASRVVTFSGRRTTASHQLSPRAHRYRCH